MDAFDIGYVVGLIVGQGSFTDDRGAPVLSVKLHDDNPDPLQALTRSLGGKVYGPYRHQERHFFIYRLRGEALRSALPFLMDHLPQGRKRDQLVAWVNQHGLWSGGPTQVPGPDEV